MIVGFAAAEITPKRLFDYEDIRGEAHELAAGNINPYLVDAEDVLLPKRSDPISRGPEIAFGSMPNDGGHLLLDAGEYQALLVQEPAAEKWIRPFLGSVELINGLKRWCLWPVSYTHLDVYKRQA